MQDGLMGQVPKSAAEIYEEFFLPALFQEWAPRVSQAASVKPGNRVLDVACGTGALLRVCAEGVKPEGKVTGLDRNAGMLEVARRVSPDASLHLGVAEDLPFEDASFDRVVSQFGLMFFEDRTKALNEMWRVLRRGGHIAVAVWGSLEDTPGYSAMTDLLERLFGQEVARELEAPYVLGDREELFTAFEESSLREIKIETIEGSACFASIEAWVYTDIKGWTLADLIDDTQYQQLLTEAKEHLRHLVAADGSVRFPAPAHIVSAAKA